ncbi:MAG: hypothetical protein K1X74_02270 [Pirellulales bacterium]|nr:hypothetical protein [Pirellulales bacterium]
MSTTHTVLRWSSWLLLAVAIFVSGMVAAGAKFHYGPPYKAESWLRAELTPPAVLFLERVPVDEFQRFKHSQTVMVTNPFVLNVALRDPRLGQLPLLKAQKDQVQFLRAHIKAEFPGDGQLMRVTMAGDDPTAIRTIVDGVVRAYLKEVVGQERLVKDMKYTKLEDVLQKNRSEIASLRKKLDTVGPDTTHGQQLEDELRTLEEVTDKVAAEVAQLKIELAAPDRVLLLDPATVMHVPLLRRAGELIAGEWQD